MIQFHYRSQVGGGTCEKYLVGQVELTAVYAPFLHLKAQFSLGQLHYRVPGYARQNVVLQAGGDHLAVGDNEQVLSGTLTDVAVLVEDYGLVKTGHSGFRLRQNAVDVDAANL